jgi:hypothetical protein
MLLSYGQMKDCQVLMVRLREWGIGADEGLASNIEKL